ncbi:AraC family transcriptional regulator [Aquimarina sp. Aq78]|uniref:AraC family transcriptional regulator n=1 Tax=Aquimarina sp. Aq78 TaxID=1191889 RepID=UPI00131EE278|nr:AraC family transcriptional regulator [Aquimarina sp. Aq78]
MIELDFDELKDNFFEIVKKDSTNAKLFAKAYLQKGKNLDSVLEISDGFLYLGMLSINDYEKRIIYLDSAIDIVKNTWHVQQTAYLHTHKGFITQQKGFYDKALEYYLEGLSHAKKKDILFYIPVLQGNIASLKRRLGKYEEAKYLYKKCLEYEKNTINKSRGDSLRYLLILSNLVTTYRLNKEIDSSFYFYKQEHQISVDMDIEGVYIIHEGIFQFYDKNYETAIKTIKKGINEFLKSKSRTSYGDHNLINGYYFLAKSYKALSNDEFAILNLKKIDSIVQKSNNLISESRPAYLELINYYKSINDKNNQLFYINRLLYNDSIFHSRYRSASDKLNKEFDTPILISQKENIIHELKAKNNQSYYVIFISSIVIIIITSILFSSYRKNKRYKKHFDELMVSTNNEVKRNNTKINEENTSIGISKDVVEIILKALNEFEKNNEFVELNITSGTLAKKINTNSKYLTKVIKFYRNKNFTHYINDLRIDHIIDQLKEDHKLRNYTIKALATEAGFNSSEVFSKSFFKKTGIYPSYFIQQLKIKKN